MPARLRVRGALLALSLGLPATLLLAGGRAAAAPASQLYFGVQTTANAVHVSLTQEPASSIVTASLVDDVLGYTSGELDTASSDSTASAASIFPGNLVVQGPQLLCDEGVLPFACPVQPPSYPLLARASYPATPTATAGQATPPQGVGLAASAALATATASTTGNTALTSGSSGSLLTGTPVATTLGSTSSVSTVTQSAGAMHVSVATSVSDIAIGQQLHIGSVVAVDTVTIRPGQKPVDVPSVRVSDVTVAGQAASIDATGIHVAGRNGPALTRAIDAAGISVHEVGVDKSDTATGARSTATGLDVTLSVPVSNVPYVPNPLGDTPPFDNIPGVDANGTYVGHLTLAAAGATAALETDTDVPFPFPTFPVSGGVVTGGSSTPTTGTATSLSVPTAGGTVGTPGTDTAPALAPAHPSPAASATITVGLSRAAIERLYLVLAIGTMALLLAWRGTMLGRFFGRRR